MGPLAMAALSYGCPQIWRAVTNTMDVCISQEAGNCSVSCSKKTSLYFWHANARKMQKLETACCHIMPPHSLRGSTGLTQIRIYCRILLPCPCHNFAQNVITSSVGGSNYLPQNFTEICSVFVRSEREYRCWHETGHRDRHRDIVKT